MTIQVDVENVSGVMDGVPDTALITQWVSYALEGQRQQAILSVRVVDEQESEALNRQYRQQQKPTNVLSFPSDLPENFDPPVLGDLAICASIVANEALAQGKELQAHWAHMIIHGTLHLLGFDHGDDVEADLMEAREVVLLSHLGFANPYE